MIFSSWGFAWFFAAVFAGYWMLPGRRWRHPFLLIASYAFYMSWNPWLVTLIVGTTLLDYFVALALERTAAPGRRRALLTVSLIGNLGILALFKYADFFIVSLRELLTGAGIQTNLQTLNILLPVGISFYTFQTLSYTIDVYRGRIAARRSLIDFALFVAFFPQLVAGPIVRAADFLPQLDTDKRFDWQRIGCGAGLFLLGLTKKVLIADQLATLVDPVFAAPMQYVTRDLWLATFCYGGQIYCDFAGYTDMAIAVACVLGFDFRPNFASPYLAVGLSDFWRRWHISLSTWLRDYLYLPLGGSRHGSAKTHRNLMLTMLLGGLWHGASWTFVIWGGLHGAALAVSKAGRRAVDRLTGPDDAHDGRGSVFGGLSRLLSTSLGWAATLLVVHVAWVFFRCQPMIDERTGLRESTAAALGRAGYFVTHLFVPAPVAQPAWIMNKLPMLVLLGLMGLMQVYEEWVRRGRPRLVLPAPAAGVGYAAWILALVIFSPANTNPFIYFQF